MMKTTCCIVGGGPAGMMAGFLLARAGVDVMVLEKHGDFLRDFRGDTVHPSTLELMHELGLLDAFLQEPHQRITQLKAVVGDARITLADLSHLRMTCPFVALVPQWNFLDFLVRQARQFPGFRLLMDVEVTGLLQNEKRVVGVRAQTRDAPLDIHAELTLGADGRDSRVRAAAGLKVQDLGAPMDVFWMRLSRREHDERGVLARLGAGQLLVMIDRDAYWQCAYVIPKGSAARLQERGLEALRHDMAELAPDLADRVHELVDWEQVRLLTVKVDRLREWFRPGLLMIGDAAHAMSPIGGVGINLAIQDAVAAANILSEPLYEKRLGVEHLAQVQKRRQLPTRLTQALQVFVQDQVVSPVLTSRTKPAVPALLKLVNAWPLLQRIPARIVGVGFRPEHVRSANRSTTSLNRSV